MNILDRLNELDGKPLSQGSHSSPDRGLCVMEAVAYVAHEKHSDTPQCVCSVIAGFMRTWNDGLRSDEERDRLLRPLIPHLLNSHSTLQVQEKRSEMALAWLVNVHIPTWLGLTPGLHDHATALRCVDTSDSEWVLPVCVARNAARDADMYTGYTAGAADMYTGYTGYTAGAAAIDAAIDAAGAAAIDAAMDAARYAARDAAGAAAMDVAKHAVSAVARNAASAAVSNALEPTVQRLQVGALDLVDRMVKVEPDE